MGLLSSISSPVAKDTSSEDNKKSSQIWQGVLFETNKLRKQSLIELQSNDLLDASGEVQTIDDKNSGICKKFHESELERFYRINKMFNPDDPTCKIKPSDLSVSDALHWYGIIMQGSYGDNDTEAPSWFSLEDRLKWNAYEGNKGMEKHEARMMFIEAAKKMLNDAGFSAENPLKP